MFLEKKFGTSSGALNSISFAAKDGFILLMEFVEPQERPSRSLKKLVLNFNLREDFKYSSDTNSQWLNKADFLKLIDN